MNITVGKTVIVFRFDGLTGGIDRASAVADIKRFTSDDINAEKRSCRRLVILTTTCRRWSNFRKKKKSSIPIIRLYRLPTAL